MQEGNKPQERRRVKGHYGEALTSDEVYERLAEEEQQKVAEKKEKQQQQKRKRKQKQLTNQPMSAEMRPPIYVIYATHSQPEAWRQNGRKAKM